MAFVEFPRFRSGDHHHAGRAASPRQPERFFDQASADALAHLVGLDEQPVEFRLVAVDDDCREPGRRAVRFGNDHAARRHQFAVDLDRIGVRQQLVAMAFIGERGAPLQGQQRRLVGRRRNPGGERHGMLRWPIAASS